MRAYLQLTRPANLVTAIADILAGAAVVNAWRPGIIFLGLASVCLYAGGVAFNDYFDRHLDATERPERPIPSGRASASGAGLMAATLLLAGILIAGRVSLFSSIAGLLIAAAALVYDRFSKRNAVAGPINMGLCRGLNLLLGMSISVNLALLRWPIALIPVFYTAAITALAAGEVHGGNRSRIKLAMVAVPLVSAAVPLLAFSYSGRGALWALPFLALLCARVLPRIWSAYEFPGPERIIPAVKTGVLSMIILDSAMAAAYAGPLYGVAVLVLTPVAIAIARAFAVT